MKTLNFPVLRAAVLRGAQVLLLAMLGTAGLLAQAQTALADRPLFSTLGVPGNLGLVLSVEFPTAISVAHTDRNYANTSTYLGYFDPDKCYDYLYTDGTSVNNYFEPKAMAATNHVCSGKWSGNFLNWASMQTIDTFRWVLTGGYRVIDTATLTVLEKAWGTAQGGTNNFPDSNLTSTSLAGATPFAATKIAMTMRIWGQGNKMRFTLPDTSTAAAVSFSAKFWNNVNRTGGAVLTRTDATVDYDWGNGSPGTGVNTDNFSGEWSASVTVPTTGNYVFRLKADDTSQLRVNGNLVIDQTSYQSMAYQYSPAIALTAGDVVTIKVNVADTGGGAALQLQWARPGDADYTTVGSGITPIGNAATAFTSVAATTGGTVYEMFMRAKVCDATAPSGVAVEKNCVAYGSNYKPEGLIQGYANKIRYSAFGYLNDSNIKRDGGVLRARQKFVGPTSPVPGSTAIDNLKKEWDSGTGVFVANPDTADAKATNDQFGTAVANSGVINYLNKFGEITPGSYKTYDNVSELYYAAVRYFKNQGNVPEWTDMTGASTADKAKWADGFPVITDWPNASSKTDPGDPIIYSCQKNFVLGIGDVNTHADKNVPGNTSTNNEPTMPAAVTADTTVNAVTATNKIGVMEGLGSTLGTTENVGGCCNNNSALIAGLAYDAHTVDLRPNDPKHIDKTYDPQTLDTYWVDVQENQQYKDNNQYYLATKYGGFDIPIGYVFKPYDAATTTIPESWWHKNSDTLGGNKRPDQYYSGGRPDLMKAGLESVFSDLDRKVGAFTTSFSSALPQLAISGNKSYASLYDAKTWTGEITGSSLAFDATTGQPSFTKQWSFTDTLATKLAGTGWSATTGRRVVTWSGTAGVAFRATGTSKVTSTQLAALNTSYVTGDDSTNYLNYLRGDRANEQDASVSDTSKVYRYRAKLVGDIVGSKARPVGAPSFPFSDSTNPGYSSFKSTWSSRPTVVYVGANDGMLHAIHGDMTGTDAGNELFAYVPSALFQGPNATPNVDGLASLGNPTFVHHYMVNASPNVYDVDFGRVPNASGAKQTGTADWRSVLIGGLGKGGKSYYAIDVTDPVGASTSGETSVAGKVLWEFSNSALGFTFGDPVVVKTKKYGWVVILTSGYNNTDGKGYFFIINPKTGALLEPAIGTGAGTTSAPAGMAHANAFVVDSTDGTADAVYAGDLLGNLWRLDLTAASGNYPAPLQLASLTDSGSNAQPVTSRPLIEVHPKTKKRYVMLGTGNLLDDSDISSTQGQTYYMISDGTNAKFNSSGDLPTATPAVTFPITRANLTANSSPLDGIPTVNASTPMGWYEDLGSGSGSIARRVVSDSSTLGGSVAFSALLPKNDDPCSQSGASTIYGRDFASAKTSLVTISGTTTTATATVDAGGNVTDLRNLSVDGKGRLISCTDTGKCRNIDTSTPAGLSLRRLNWRELQLVD